MASEREKLIAGLTSSSAICSEGKLAEKAYDAGYKAGVEAAAKAADNEHLLDATGIDSDIAYDSAVDDCVNAIRALAEGEKP